MARILGTESTLEEGLEQVSSLRDDRQGERNHSEGEDCAQCSQFCDGDSDEDGPQQTSNGSRPSLIGAHLRHKLGASERTASEIGADIGHPHDRKQKEHGEEAVLFVSAQHHRRYRQRARIGDGAGDPGTLLRERERRSPQRLTVELAGLCLGLIDRRGTSESGAIPLASVAADPLRDLLTLPSVIAHEARNPLSAARAGLQLAAETVGRLTGLAAAERHDLLVELGEVEEAVDRTIDFLRAVADRARGSRSGPERFDVVHAVRSAVALESLLLRGRGMKVELISDLDQVYIEGERNLVYELVSNLVLLIPAPGRLTVSATINEAALPPLYLTALPGP